MSIDVIFFDVGNTLVFPDHEKTLAPLWSRRIRPTEEQLRAAERTARQQMDAAAFSAKKVDQQYWENYYEELLQTLGINDALLQRELVALARTSSNWSRVRPGTTEVLNALKNSYRLAVISNSDGHMADRLASLGLGPYFEHVIDSRNVGHEKPAPQIFEAALNAMSAPAEKAMYLGDIYSVDYVGARKVGMRAMLMDVAGVYTGRNLPRIERLADLESALQAAKVS